MDDASLLSCIQIGRIIAASLVAVGVVGEVAGDILERPIIHRLEANTALAQKESAEARLKLDQWFAKKIFHRIANLDNFERLKTLPKSRVTVLYKEGDGEAFMYASTLVQGFKGIGWTVVSDKPLPTTHHPMAGNEGNPIIGTFVLANSIPHGGEIFEQMKSPTLPAWLVSAAVEGHMLESKSIPENTFQIVVGEYLRSWNP